MKSGSMFFYTIVMICSLVPVSAFGASKDSYEDDNSHEQARKIVINLETPQLHSFHEAADQDWIKFYGFKDKTYAIKAVNTGSCDLYLELYDANNMSAPMKVQDNPLDPFADEILSTGNVLQHDGIYYVKISEAGSFGENCSYELTAYIPEGASPGDIYGFVTDAVTGNPIGDALIVTDQLMSDFSRPDNGEYQLKKHPPDSFTLTARQADYAIEKDNYLSCVFSDNLPENGTKEINIGMIPLDLAGAVLTLQIISGNMPQHLISWQQDINGDQKIGLAETIYIMRKVAQLGSVKK